MRIIADTDLRHFQFWSGAVDNANQLSLEQLDEVEAILEDAYPDGMTDTQINDLFWVEFDTIKEWIGLKLQESDFEYLVDESHMVLSNGAEVELSTSQDWAGSIYLDGEVTFEDADGEEQTISDSVEFDVENYDKDEAEACLRKAMEELKDALESEL